MFWWHVAVILFLGFYRLIHMWRTMCECHQIQNHISQQLNCISLDQITDLTSDYHRQAALQLEAEVESWYHSFCYLIKSQKVYVKTLCGWVQLTESLTDDQEQRSSFSSAVHSLCDQWLHHLERVPDQVLQLDLNLKSRANGQTTLFH